jgi:hypothetical protein
LNWRFKTGYHYDYKMNTPMANPPVTILDSAGVPIEKLGASTGPLALDPLTVGQTTPSERTAAARIAAPQI